MSEQGGVRRLRAFPWDCGPQYLLRDRDQIFGREFTEEMRNLGNREVLVSPRQRAHISSGSSRPFIFREKDAPEHRAVQAPALVEEVAIPQVGGLRHCYERRAT
jgi:hypothetical protein